MFEHRHDYPMAVTAATGAGRDVVQLAIDWLRRTTDDVGGQPLVYLPNKAAIREQPLLARLEGWAVVTTWKSFGSWAGGAVLAAWPTTERLAEVADDPRTRALCVVPNSPTEVAAWVRAYRPVTLPPTLAVATPEPALIADPVVVEGLKTLTAIVNVTSLYASGGDRDKAVEVLLTLHDGGHRMNADDARAWALAHGWSARAAEQLVELAQPIAAGKRLRTRGGVLAHGILDRWRTAANWTPDPEPPRLDTPGRW